jgi:hypothetical protein
MTLIPWHSEPWLTLYQFAMAVYDGIAPRRRAIGKSHRARMAYLRDYPKSAGHRITLRDQAPDGQTGHIYAPPDDAQRVRAGVPDAAEEPFHDSPR